jgi:uncharacterized MAPEG superfamily protein
MQNLLITTFIFVACTFLLVSPASAQVTFTFNYTDAPGVGFKDASNGAARRNAVELAGANFANAFSSYTANIVLDISGGDTGDTLMSAAGRFDDTPSIGFGLDEVILNKVLNGTDLNGSAADGDIRVNFETISWQLDINATTTQQQFDWYSTVYHELTHAFGYGGAIDSDGTVAGTTDGYSNYDPNGDGSWGAFDQFLTDSAGASLFDSTFPADLDEQRYASLLTGGNSSTGNGLFFSSPSTGQRYGLYTPATFEPGSSGSHLDDDNPALSNQLMFAATDTGPAARQFSDIDLAILKDIGYTNVGQIGPLAPAIPGDFDSDGDVDGDDVDFYIGNIGSAATGALAQLDLDSDGTVSIEDHNTHVTTLVQTSNGVTGAPLGDVNLDGKVDVLNDGFALVAGLNQTATSRGQGDLNADGTVNVLGDGFILVGGLGQSNGAGSDAGAIAVPEPGSQAIFAITIVAVTVRRRRWRAVGCLRSRMNKEPVL